MDKEGIIALLNKDLADEHGAIIQYLTHAYAIGEGEMTCEIEALAREEMRHLDWLARTVVKLGGTPTLERGTMRQDGDSVAGWMENNVLLEEGAIAQYKEHIGLISDRPIKRLLRRILSDEESHRGDFEHFAAKAKREGAKDIRGNRSGGIIESLNQGIGHEYTVILQYMLHSYITTDEEAKRQLEDQAVNEMQHLGWLAEKTVDKGGSPRIEHAEVDRSTNTADMLRVDIKIERKVADTYGRIAREARDPKVKKLLLRLRDHELYHAEVFSDLLNKGQE